jgi:hypothetical protein
LAYSIAVLNDEIKVLSIMKTRFTVFIKPDKQIPFYDEKEFMDKFLLSNPDKT